MARKNRSAAWGITAIVFALSFGVLWWLWDPLGEPDSHVLLAVELVFAVALAMLVNAVARPQSRIGDQTGLGAPSVSISVALVTLAVAGVALASVGLRHPVVGGVLAALAAASLVLRTVITRFLTRLFWGVPLDRHPEAVTFWKAEFAAIAGHVKNEPFLERLSEVQALCAAQPSCRKKVPEAARALDPGITAEVKRLREQAEAGDLGKAVASLDLIRDKLKTRLEACRGPQKTP